MPLVRISSDILTLDLTILLYLGNTIAKGGYESSNVYYNCRIEFMNIGNIHQMRDSWQRVMSIAKSSYEGGDDYRWCSDLENTGWLKVYR